MSVIVCKSCDREQESNDTIKTPACECGNTQFFYGPDMEAYAAFKEKYQ